MTKTMKTYYINMIRKGSDIANRLIKIKATSEKQAIMQAKKQEFDGYRHYKAIGLMPNINPAGMVQQYNFTIFN